MKDPQKPIIQAVYDALSGLALPVYLTLPLGVDQYILLAQPTLNPGSGSAACLAWDGTLLVSVYTKFDRDKADAEPALDVSSEIIDRLVGKRLNLGAFSMSPMELQRLSMPQRYDEKNVYVEDKLRLRFTVYAEPTVLKPAGKPLNDYTPAEVLGYDKLDQLGPLNCPVVLPEYDVTEVAVQFTDTSSDGCTLVLGEQNVPILFTSFEVSGGAAAVAINNSVGPASYVGAPGDILTITRVEGNPLVKAVYNSQFV